jgi:hypothetical protein
MTTPGQLRMYEAQARRDSVDYRQWAHEATDPARKRYFERCAENREDDATYYADLAGRGEITVDYVDLTHYAEAAE